MLYAWLDTIEQIDSERPIILQSIYSAVDREFDGEVAFAGFGVVFDALNRATVKDGALFTLLSWSMVIIVLKLITKTIWWTLIALLSVICANLFVFSLMALLNRPVTMVSVALAPLIMVLGVAVVIHLFRHWQQIDTSNTQKPILLSLYAVIVPCFFNMLTTAGGYFSLSTARMAVTRDYGLFAAAGAVSVFLFALILTALFGKVLMDRKQSLPFTETNRFGLIAQKITTCCTRSSTLILITSVLVGITGLLIASGISVDTFSIGLLPPDHLVRQHSDHIEQKAGNYLPMEFLLRLSEHDSWNNPETIERLKRVHQAVYELPQVDNYGMSAALTSDALALYGSNHVASPIQKRRLEQLFNGLISPDQTTLRFTIKAPMASAVALNTLSSTIADTVQSIMGHHVVVEKSGYLPLYGRIIDNVLSDQIVSFLVAFSVIFILIWILFRSWRYVAVALPSNLLPVIAVLALMRLFGINLDIATVTIAATVLGIIVDDTIHMLFSIRNNLRKGIGVEESIADAAKSSGSAIISTSIILAAGFLIMAFSSVASIAYTGILTAAAVLAAVVADLVVLPAAAKVFLREQ